MRRTKIFLLIFCGLLAGAGFCAAASAGNGPSASAMISSARVPFVANEGQVANPDVKYYARTFGGTVYALSGGKIVYSLPKFESGKKSGSAVLIENLSGALQNEPEGAGKSPVSVNSFIGNRPENWRSNLPAYDRLDFGEVYEGITLLLSARANNVEKIFVVSPGADPREIAFGFEGAEGLEVTDGGELEVLTALGPVYFTRPAAWQIDAAGQSRPVAVDYALDEDGKIGFELSAYSPDNILVIDPLLASTFIGGGGADAVQALVVDSQTNVYIAGYTDSSDFPTTNAPYSSALSGGQDAFVSKFNADLGSLSASTYIGGSSNDQATAIGIDAASRIWLAGYTESTNFPHPSSPMYTTNNGGRDAFAAILAGDLSSLVQATYLGGSNDDYAAAIAMDNTSFRQYIAGYTESGNFPVTAAGYQTNYSGARDAFAVVFSNAVGSAYFKGGTFLGGTNADETAGVVVSPGTDLTNFVYVVGSTSSTNFPVTNGYQMTHGGSNDVFVSKLSALLTNLSASTFLGGTADDNAYAVGLDLSNKVYVAGYTRSSNYLRNPSNNVYLTGWTNAWRGGQDVFVTCLTNNLTNLYASTYAGGTGDDAAKCLVVDSSSASSVSYIYLAGYTTSSNFPNTRNAYDRSYNGGQDAFTLRLDGRLTNMYASTYLGGGGNDQALALALGPESNTLFTAGITASSDFPASDAAYETAFRGGSSDGFVTKFPASLAYGTVKWQKFLDRPCSSPALTWDGTVIIGASTSVYGFTRSGIENWRRDVTSTVAYHISDYVGFGCPAVWTNNIAYINTSTGKVYAITAAGTMNLILPWAVPLSYWSSVTPGSDGKLFFSQGANFYSINQNGAGLWTNSMANNSWSSPAISSNGIVYSATYLSPKLYAFDSAGSTNHVWNMGGAGAYMYSSPALGTNGTIYAAASNILYAFSSDGLTTQTWTVGSGNYSWSSPAVASNGVIYVGGGNSLYAFTNGGTGKVWRTGGTVKSSPTITADGSIIVGSTDSNVYSFNPDGTTNWIFVAEDDLELQTPLIDSEGTIYVSDDSSIYAIYGSQPPADGPWPMFRHDALRTGNQGMNAADFLRPSGLSVSEGTFTNYVSVSWNASSNSLNYELWRSPTNSTATAERIRRLTQTNYNDSSVDHGKIYYYWVKVKTPIALSGFSASDSGGVPPYPPENVSASDGVPTNYVQVTWQASSNAAAYYVYRGLSDSTNTAEIIETTSSTNYDDHAVQPGLRYYYRVKAGNAEAGISGFSGSDYGGIPCWPPAGLSASQGAYTQRVDLSWYGSTNAGSYIVYRNTENNAGTAGIISNTTGLTMSDRSGTQLRRYYYWTRATNEFGLSGYSASALGWSLLMSPLSVSASAGTYSNMIRVSWVVGSSNDTTSHVIFRGENSDPSAAARQSEVVFTDNTATNYDDTAITRGVSYYYWVAAKNSYGTSFWTAASAPGGTIPSTPSDLSATDGSYSNMVLVTWSSSPGASYYTVYRHQTFDSSYATLIGSASVNFYEDTGALHGVLYYYWVKAGNNFGLSDLSTFNAGWRGMDPPDSISAGNGTSTSEVSITWSAAPDATTYELWRGTGSNIASAGRLANNISAVSSPSYSDRSANPGTVYYYWVKSKRGNYSSAFSGYDYGYRSIGLLDIAVSDLVFVPSVFGPLAHPSAASFLVSNLSALDMNDPDNTVQYDFYLSRNSVFDDNVYWIGGSSVSVPLSAGASSRVVCPADVKSSITVPSGFSGGYYVFVYVNHCLPSTWTDPNLANNVARRLGNAISIGSTTAFQPVWNDFDGDGKSDFAVYCGVPSAGSGQGTWKVWLSASGYARVDLTGFGGSGYRAVPRDYDCDGKLDLAVYLPAVPSAQPMQAGQAGTWLVCLSGSGYQTVSASGLGGAGQYAVPADYDGDGKADPAVYNEASGIWRVWPSASGYGEQNISGLGGTGRLPAQADYDGDGKTDPAVYEEATPSSGSGQAGTWQVMLSGSGYALTQVLLQPTLSDGVPIPGDYDADGRVDPAVYQPADGGWRVWLSGSGYQENSASGWGGAGQYAVPGDYDGDGRVDPAVYWESMGIWRLWCSSYGYSEMDVLAPGGEGFHAITFGE